MISTEKEAKAKYCPMHVKLNCIGSDCMWWTWIPVNRFASIEEQEKTPTGYCGGMKCHNESIN